MSEPKFDGNLLARVRALLARLEDAKRRHHTLVNQHRALVNQHRALVNQFLSDQSRPERPPTFGRKRYGGRFGGPLMLN